MKDTKLKGRYFRVEYSPIEGGQVDFRVVEFYELRVFKMDKEEEGFNIESCVELI